MNESQDELVERIAALEAGIDRLNETMVKSEETMARFNKYTGSWKMRILQGMALGFGSAWRDSGRRARALV